MELRQGTAVQVADRQLRGTPAMLPGQDMAAEQALIPEARARTRRRRLKIALAALAAAAVLSAGVLITLTVPGKLHKAGAIAPAGPAIRTGTVTGHLAPCTSVAARIDPGWVTVVRGTRNSRQPMIAPSGPVVARARITNNFRQLFRFALPAGTYVLIGTWGATPFVPGTHIGGLYTLAQVSVTAGKTLHTYLPGNMCG